MTFRYTYVLLQASSRPFQSRIVLKKSKALPFPTEHLRSNGSICFLSRGPALEQSLPAGLNQVTGVRFPLVFRVHFKWPCTQNITSAYKLKGTIIHCNIRNSKCRKHFISRFTTRQHLHAMLGRKLQGTVSPRRNQKWPGNARDHMLELQPFREVWMCSDTPWVSKSVEIEPT